MALCLLYAVLLALHWGTAPGAAFASLAAVQTLFAVPGTMLARWGCCCMGLCAQRARGRVAQASAKLKASAGRAEPASAATLGAR